MPETNEHLWFCPNVINLLIPIFNKYHSVLKFLITSNSESLPTLFTDAIRFCRIFSWTNNPPRSISDAPDLHYILLNLIPNELIHPFKAAKIGKKLTKKLLITFLFDLHQDIYNTIWRERTTRWKERKEHKYRQQSKSDNNGNFNRNNDLYHTQGYTNPFINTRRALDSSILWIYLNFRYNLP
ncbi:hypothetical protein RhiirA4_458517 [Rhizophagus irregularis]|uniref:Uncharacterized protein n=1 Tax=Rhizophagus irregularis TaxID=588596 RepID=A0A2I1GCB7_9GLOM|nr:hypothetical protein RhiirA4_458517 [Rhizophagus irregularis]